MVGKHGAYLPCQTLRTVLAAPVPPSHTARTQPAHDPAVSPPSVCCISLPKAQCQTPRACAAAVRAARTPRTSPRLTLPYRRRRKVRRVLSFFLFLPPFMLFFCSTVPSLRVNARPYIIISSASLPGSHPSSYTQYSLPHSSPRVLSPLPLQPAHLFFLLPTSHSGPRRAY